MYIEAPEDDVTAPRRRGRVWANPKRTSHNRRRQRGVRVLVQEVLSLKSFARHSSPGDGVSAGDTVIACVSGVFAEEVPT